MSNGKKKKRVDTSVPDEPLKDNPFEGLSDHIDGELPQAKPQQAKAAPSSKPAAPYSVSKSRKGNWPLSIERRSGGKTVTILGNVSGDADALAKALKQRCGAGGKAEGDHVELQGDQRDAVGRFLDEHLG